MSKNTKDMEKNESEIVAEFVIGEDGKITTEAKEDTTTKVIVREDGTVERIGLMGNYVNKDGDTITGNIVVSGDITFTTNTGVTVGLKDIFKYVYPVGSIYMTKNGGSPSSMFGGVWSLISSSPYYTWERTL